MSITSLPAPLFGGSFLSLHSFFPFRVEDLWAKDDVGCPRRPCMTSTPPLTDSFFHFLVGFSFSRLNSTFYGFGVSCMGKEGG